MSKSIFDLSKEDKIGCLLPECDVPLKPLNEMIPDNLIREDLNLPEVSELDVVRHYTELSNLNFGVDSGFYPLGSCTMKYNPKINEDIAKINGLVNIHPYQEEEHVQGSLELMYILDKMLSEITGMSRMSLQPAAGAHGEMTGLMIIKAYHENRGDSKRNKIIVPDSAHGTNPASATIVGYETIEVKSNEKGGIDLNHLKDIVNDTVAGLMLTNPNTLGIFDENILEVSEIIHKAGGLLYYDGANLNAIMGITRPGDMGFDVVHLNLHKTFSTPHGMGGPGSGPVGVRQDLVQFLPKPMIEVKDDKYYLDYNRPFSIGKIKAFYGNFSVIVKAYSYILTMGGEGLKKASEIAVLNANYLLSRLKNHFDLPYDTICMHEFVLSSKSIKDEYDILALDIAKRLLDYGYHPPTIYFPLIVKEALMIEPTETESKETLDSFAEALISIVKEIKENPQAVKEAPFNTPVKRLDELKAAKDLKLRW